MEKFQSIIHPETQISPHILIMEDELSVAKGLEMVLTEEGYMVDLAMTGQSAINSLKNKDFDMLIADLRLPDIDGMEVIKQVKTIRPDTGVIVITGYSTVPSAIEAMRLGAHDYLPKPFTSDEFMSAVRQALSVQQNVHIKPQRGSALPEEAIPELEPLPENLRQMQAIIKEIKNDFVGKREEIIPMLQRVQNRFGYIPQIVMEEIAYLTKAPSAAVYGVATFFKQFRSQPIGRHIVKVCRGTACHVKGAENILNEIKACYQITSGQTSSDRMLTVETVACFGSCAIAPVIVLDDHVKGRMNPTKTRDTLNKLSQEEESQFKG